jgi:hypothetical protein
MEETMARSVWQRFLGKKVLGLREAEVVFDRANGMIKGDGSKAVPFAIIVTAEVLGAEVRVEQDCKESIADLEGAAQSTGESQVQLTQVVTEIILDLQKQIAEKEISLQEAGEVATRQISELMSRKDKVSQVRDFFNIDGAALTA